jgi:hypothetical protein
MTVEGRILGEGAPGLPRYLVDELEFVHRDLRWMYMPDHKCWAVVTPGPPRADGRRFLIEALLLDDNGKPIDPGMEIIKYLKQLKWEKDHRGSDDNYLATMDAEEVEATERAEKERRAMFTDFYKKVYGFLHTKTFT